MAGRHAVSVTPLAFERREERHTTEVGGAAVLAARTRAAAAAALEGRGLEIPISVPVNGKSDIFTPLYLSNQNGSQHKLIGFGHGAPPQAQIR